MVSKDLLHIQENLIHYLADEYVDIYGNKKAGLNRLNETLEEYNIKFNKFGIGLIDNFTDSFIYVMISGSTSIDAPANLGTSRTIKDKFTMQVIGRQNTNQTKSTVMFNAVNLVIQECIRDWWFNNDMEVQNISEPNFIMLEPEFYFNDNNSINAFNSVNAIRYTNAIEFNITTYKDLY